MRFIRAGFISLAVCTTFPWAAARGDVPAFPGADGAGAAVTGGRGGVVYHVTRLDGEINGNRTVFGTLAYGLSDSNFKDASNNVIPRTIVFDVGGTIWLGRKGETEGWDTQDPLSAGSKITIAGQTAPGGINILGGGLKANGANSIIRNVTIAPGYGARSLNSTTGYADSYVYDGMNIHADGVMIDHVSTVFSTDEGISADEVANNVTVQYCNISQGQNYPQADAENPGVYTGHALGSLWQPGSNAKTSVLHNLYAHQKGRLPRVGTEASKLTTAGVGAINDFRNNVFYNWLGTGGSGASAQPSTNNFVGNFWLAGPGGDDNSGTQIVSASGGTGIFSGNSGPTGVFNSGNLKDTNKDGDALDGVALTNSDFSSSTIVGAPYSVPYNGVTDTATAAYNRVLNYAGANWQNRDTIDARIVNEARTGTGKISAFNDPNHGTEWNALLALRPTNGVAPFSRPANFDTDGDGMPDVWEAAHGLNLAVADNNGDYDNNGYTNLEEYLNELAAFPAPGPIVFTNASGNGRYAQIGNWATGVFEPSRFDEAQINSGSVLIDAVGQHAGTLKIATNAGSNATLAVNSGWIDIAQSLMVGPAGTGQTSQSGGIVHAGTSVTIGASSSYTMTGGTLSTPLLSRTGSGTFNFLQGTLHADRVAFSLTNQGGTIAPGSDLALQMIALAGFPDAGGISPAPQSIIGNTTVNGDLTLLAGSLQIQLASPTSFDTLSVDGVLSLGGTLDVQLVNGYPPQPGDQWKIGTASAIQGNFTSVTSGFDVQTSGGNLFLVAVPEPAALGMVGLFVVAGSATRSRARRRT